MIKGLLVACVALALSVGGGVPSLADEYPSAPIRVIYPYAAGGSGDALVRLFADGMTKELGQQVFVENRPGAGGNLGFSAGARAPADGYTLISISPAYAINATLSRDPGFKPSDFVPVAAASVVPNILLVPVNSPFKSLDDLVKFAKENPGKLSFGSSGVGSSTHFASEVLKAQAKIDIVHIPYGGAAAVGADLLGGRLDLIFDSAPSALANVRTGKARPLIVASKQRSAQFPDVPTSAEAGMPELLVEAWTGFLAPKGTPQAVIDKLTAAVDKVRNDPATIAGLTRLGGRPLDLTQSEFDNFLRSEIKRFGDIVKAINLKP